MCGVVLLTPVQRVLVLTVLVGCKFFVLELFRSCGTSLWRSHVRWNRIQSGALSTPGQTTDENLYRRPPPEGILLFFPFFYCLSFSFILFYWFMIYLHYLKPGPILRNASAFFRFVLFYLIYFLFRREWTVLFWGHCTDPGPVFNDTSKRNGAGLGSALPRLWSQSLWRKREMLSGSWNSICVLSRDSGKWGLLKAKLFHPGRTRGPDELVAILCKTCTLILAVS